MTLFLFLNRVMFSVYFVAAAYRRPNVQWMVWLSNPGRPCILLELHNA